MIRWPSTTVAVWGRCPGVLWDSQYVEAGRYCWDPGPLRFGLHHPQWQRPPQVHTPIRRALELSQEHPSGPRMGDQWDLSHTCAPGTASRSERQVPAARQCGSLHTRAPPLQCWERAEKCRRGSSTSSEIHRCLLKLKKFVTDLVLSDVVYCEFKTNQTPVPTILNSLFKYWVCVFY